jgi:NitT/TauT family transport system ATP-binding protein
MIEISHLSKTFRSDTGDQSVLENFDLEIGMGEVVTIFGPNGCGKSTLLNILAGLIEPNEGSVVRFADKTDNFAVGYVFQNYADTLLPWLKVRANIAFPLEIRKLSSEDIDEKVESRLKQFGLEQLGERFIYELSGGQKQLVAIARAMVYEPDLLILDEPFSQLDFSVARGIWTQLWEMWRSEPVTTLCVSHNVDEAVFLGERVCVLSTRPGRVVEDVSVPLGRDRSLSLLTSREFFLVRNRVLEAFARGAPA